MLNLGRSEGTHSGMQQQRPRNLHGNEVENEAVRPEDVNGEDNTDDGKILIKIQQRQNTGEDAGTYQQSY